MTANVEIVTVRVARTLRVPSAALRFRPRAEDRLQRRAPAGTHVFVATADPFKPERRRVRLGLEGEEFVQILGGLKHGERVLVRTRSAVQRPADDDEVARTFERIAEFPAPIGPGAGVGAILFSAVIGLIFGGYPAVRASRMSPIEALRSE